MHMNGLTLHAYAFKAKITSFLPKDGTFLVSITHGKLYKMTKESEKLNQDGWNK